MKPVPFRTRILRYAAVALALSALGTYLWLEHDAARNGRGSKSGKRMASTKQSRANIVAIYQSARARASAQTDTLAAEQTEPADSGLTEIAEPGPFDSNSTDGDWIRLAPRPPKSLLQRAMPDVWISPEDEVAEKAEEELEPRPRFINDFGARKLEWKRLDRIKFQSADELPPLDDISVIGNPAPGE